MGICRSKEKQTVVTTETQSDTSYKLNVSNYLSQLSDVNFKSINKYLQENYNLDESVTSTSLDIIALYLKGQKILYIEAKSLCEKRLNWLMIPAISISAACTVLNFAAKQVDYGVYIMSSLNAINSLLLALISYLKLDAQVQAHSTTSHKFEKLETFCEIKSGKILFLKQTGTLDKILEDIESKAMEVIESNEFILPEAVRRRYSTIYFTNVFTLVKKVQATEIQLVNEYKTVIRYLKYYYEKYEELTSPNKLRAPLSIEPEGDGEIIKIKEDIPSQPIKIHLDIAHISKSDDPKEQVQYILGQISELEIKKEAILNRIIEHKNNYLNIKLLFKDEIDNQNIKKKKRWCC
jgi:hypothetical protein